MSEHRSTISLENLPEACRREIEDVMEHPEGYLMRKVTERRRIIMHKFSFDAAARHLTLTDVR